MFGISKATLKSFAFTAVAAAAGVVFIVGPLTLIKNSLPKIGR